MQEDTQRPSNDKTPLEEYYEININNKSFTREEVPFEKFKEKLSSPKGLKDYYELKVSNKSFTREEVPFEKFSEKLGFSTTENKDVETKDNTQDPKGETAEVGSGVLRHPITSKTSTLKTQQVPNNTQLILGTLTITALVILTLYVLRIKTYKQKVKAISKTCKSICTKWKAASIIKTSLWYSVALALGTVLGFYYKKPNAQMLGIALNKPSEWKKNLFLEVTRANTAFFELNTKRYGSFQFNWYAFFISTLIIIWVYTLVNKTKIIAIIKSKLKPYLK